MKETINMRCLLTSQSVSEGSPDKVCDQISDMSLDKCLKAGSVSRVVYEIIISNGIVE